MYPSGYSGYEGGQANCNPNADPHSMGLHTHMPQQNLPFPAQSYPAMHTSNGPPWNTTSHPPATAFGSTGEGSFYPPPMQGSTTPSMGYPAFAMSPAGPPADPAAMPGVTAMAATVITSTTQSTSLCPPMPPPPSPWSGAPDVKPLPPIHGNNTYGHLEHSPSFNPSYQPSNHWMLAPPLPQLPMPSNQMIGPFLRFNDYDPAQGTFNVSVLIVAHPSLDHNSVQVMQQTHALQHGITSRHQSTSSA